MKLRIVILGLSITSSWGNGHATIYRGLVRELVRRDHDVLFLERDKPWYAMHRDMLSLADCEKVRLYESVEDLKRRFGSAIETADCVIVGSYVPDGIEIGKWITENTGGIPVFYDIDTPVTQATIACGKCEYLSADIAARYAAYLSFTGGQILKEIARNYGLRVVRPFYCCVDPDHYFPEPSIKQFDLGYLGTYSPDRQAGLERLLLAPASLKPGEPFIVAGPMYPATVAWPSNVRKVDHIPPSEHRAFYNAQRFTLNITRGDMLKWGYSPSVRLFEAAACGVPIISDRWPGLSSFFEPGKEILTADSGKEVLDYLYGLGAREAQSIAECARQRILQEHTATHRAAELESLILELSGATRPGAKRNPSYDKHKP